MCLQVIFGALETTAVDTHVQWEGKAAFMYCMEQDGHNTACTCMYVVVVCSFRGLLISVVRAADVSTHLKMLV